MRLSEEPNMFAIYDRCKRILYRIKYRTQHTEL